MRRRGGERGWGGGTHFLRMDAYSSGKRTRTMVGGGVGERAEVVKLRGWGEGRISEPGERSPTKVSGCMNQPQFVPSENHSVG